MFWKWSAMASLLSLYLFLIAPIIMGIVIHNNHKKRYLSKYHQCTYQAAIFYYLLLPTTIILSLVFDF